jgi:TIR domain-containing protein
MKIFISYSELELDALTGLVTRLRNEGYEIVTSRDIPLGDRRRLDEALLSCDTVIFIMTEAFQESDESKHLVLFSVEHKTSCARRIASQIAMLDSPTTR